MCKFFFNKLDFYIHKRLFVLIIALSITNIAHATEFQDFKNCFDKDFKKFKNSDICHNIKSDNSKNLNLYIKLAESFDKKKWYDKSVNVYKSAIKIFPHNSLLKQKLSLSNSYLKEQSYFNSKKPRKKSASSVKHKLNKIRCTRMSGKKALKACNLAIKYDSKDASLYLAKSNLLVASNNDKQAIIALKKVIKISPNNKIAKSKLSVLRKNNLELSSKKQKKAEKVAKKILPKKYKKPENVAKKTAHQKQKATLKIAKLVIPDNHGEAKKITTQTKQITQAKAQQIDFIEQLNLLKSLNKNQILSDEEYEKRKLFLIDSQFKTLAVRDVASKTTVSTIKKKPKRDLSKINFGNYYALIIGNNNYKDVPKLETAVNDAQAVAKILKENFNFKVKLLLNATRYETLKALGDYRSKLRENDNFFIYYAGHGMLDKDSDRGYWLPIDAEQNYTTNWISTADITDNLKAIQSKHILVVADSCYSGTLTRGLSTIKIKTPKEQLHLIKRLLKKKSRTIMTSGGLEPVSDSGRDNHSVFAAAFLDALTDIDDISEAEKIFPSVREKVILNADQTPEYSNVRKVGHNGGDFIFLRTK